MGSHWSGAIIPLAGLLFAAPTIAKLEEVGVAEVLNQGRKTSCLLTVSGRLALRHAEDGFG